MKTAFKWFGGLVALSFALVLWGNASEVGRWAIGGLGFVAYVYYLLERSAAQDRALIIQQLQVAVARIETLERKIALLEGDPREELKRIHL